MSPGRSQPAMSRPTNGRDTGPVIDAPLAAALRDAGLPWTPRPGDWFVVDMPGMETEAFLLSDMTVELQDHASGRIIRFNGTTEWALDSVQQDEALWLPSESALRSALGRSLLRLEQGDGGWTAVVRRGGDERSFPGDDAERAYGAALLSGLRSGELVLTTDVSETRATSPAIPVDTP